MLLAGLVAGSVVIEHVPKLMLRVACGGASMSCVARRMCLRLASKMKQLKSCFKVGNGIQFTAAKEALEALAQDLRGPALAAPAYTQIPPGCTPRGCNGAQWSSGVRQQ
jgi:hypothetical protein